ncbi:uncharacterized protein LOC108678296 isoform X2 [Hyalella azteca]|uniref:Uncharacterized protein LOC108678296 isoform X2 n=1 Tax=Hyalella azteca TaxID=294128 RepID=A0A979FW84_HYAAZ|nr:uncharacterized protein LOC108678296 isoform X2 [Hyalella azteca]
MHAVEEPRTFESEIGEDTNPLEEITVWASISSSNTGAQSEQEPFASSAPTSSSLSGDPATSEPPRSANPEDGRLVAGFDEPRHPPVLLNSGAPSTPSLARTVDCGACGPVQRSEASCAHQAVKSQLVFHSSEVPGDCSSAPLASDLSVHYDHSCIVTGDKCSSVTALTPTAGAIHTMEQSKLMCSEVDSNSKLPCSEMQDSAGSAPSSEVCSEKLVHKVKTETSNSNDSDINMSSICLGQENSSAECNGSLTHPSEDSELDSNKNIIGPPQPNVSEDMAASLPTPVTVEAANADGSQAVMPPTSPKTYGAPVQSVPSSSAQMNHSSLEPGAALANGQVEHTGGDDTATVSETILNELATVLADTNMFKNEASMQSESDSNNYVPLSVLLNTAPIRAITSDPEALKKALEKADSKWDFDSATGRVRMRPGRNVLILREMKEDITQEDILGIFKDPCPPVQSARYVASGCWYITFESGDEAYTAFLYLHQHVKSFRGESIKARIKSNQATPMTTFSGNHARAAGAPAQTGQQVGVAGVAITTTHLPHIAGSVPSTAAAAGSPLLYHPHTLHPHHQHHHHHHHHPAAVAAAGSPSIAPSHLAAPAACYPAQPYYNIQHPMPAVFYPSPLMTQWTSHQNNFLDFSQFVSFNGLNPTSTYKPTAGQLGPRFSNGNTNSTGNAASANNSSAVNNKNRDTSRVPLPSTSSGAAGPSGTTGGSAGPHSLPSRLFSRPHSSPSPSAPLPSQHTSAAYSVPFSSYSQPTPSYVVPYSYANVQPQLTVSGSASLQHYHLQQQQQQQHQQQQESSVINHQQQHMSSSNQQQQVGSSNSASAVASDNSSSNSTTTQQDSGRSSPLLMKTDTPPVPPLLTSNQHHSKNHDVRSPNAPLIPQPPFLHPEGSHNSPLMGTAPPHSLHHRTRFNSNNSGYPGQGMYGHQRGGPHPVNMSGGGSVHRNPYHHHHQHHHPPGYGIYSGGPPHHYMGRDAMSHRPMRGMPPRNNNSGANNNTNNNSNSHSNSNNNSNNNNNNRGRQRQRDEGSSTSNTGDDRQSNAMSSHRLSGNNRHSDNNRSQQKHQSSSINDSSSRSNNSNTSLSSASKLTQAQQVLGHQQQFALESDSFPPLPGADENSSVEANSLVSNSPTVSTASEVPTYATEETSTVSVASAAVPVTSSNTVTTSVAPPSDPHYSSRGSDASASSGPKFSDVMKKPRVEAPPALNKGADSDASAVTNDASGLVNGAVGDNSNSSSTLDSGKEQRQPRAPRNRRSDAAVKNGNSNTKTQSNKPVLTTPTTTSSPALKLQQNNSCNISNSINNNVSSSAVKPPTSVSKPQYGSNVPQPKASVARTSSASASPKVQNVSVSPSVASVLPTAAPPAAPPVPTTPAPLSDRTDGDETESTEGQDGGDDGGWITKKAKEPRGHRFATRGGRDHHHTGASGGHYGSRGHKDQSGYSGYSSHQPTLNGNASPPPSSSRSAPPNNKGKIARSSISEVEDKTSANSSNAAPVAANCSVAALTAPVNTNTSVSVAQASEASEPVTTWAHIAGQGPKKAPAVAASSGGVGDGANKDSCTGSSTSATAASSAGAVATSATAAPLSQDKDKRSTLTRPTRGTPSRFPDRGGGRGSRGAYGQPGRGGMAAGRREHGNREYSSSSYTSSRGGRSHYNRHDGDHHPHHYSNDAPRLPAQPSRDVPSAAPPPVASNVARSK